MQELLFGVGNQGRLLFKRGLSRALPCGRSSRCKGLRLESFHLVGGEPRCPALLEQSDQDGKWTESGWDLIETSRGRSVSILIIKVETTHKP